MTKPARHVGQSLSFLLATTALVVAGPAAAQPRVGVTSATDGDPRGKPPAEAERVLRIGIDVQANEVITTQANDRAHLVFLDGTSLTVGPNAQLAIDKFVYDPSTKTGDLAISATTGVLRLVGGKISKTNAITVKTPSSTTGIRGGVAHFSISQQSTTSSFLFGHSMTVSGQGHTQNVTRQGTQVTTNSGAPPGAPTLMSRGALTGQMNQLEGRGGQGGGQGGGGGGGGGQGGGGGGAGNPGANNAEAGAQNFGRQNSNQGPSGLSGPGLGNQQGPGPGQGPGQGQGPGGANPPGPPPPSDRVLQQVTTNSTTVVTSYGTIGRFIAQPPYTGFNNTDLGVTPNATNFKTLAATGNVTTTTSTTNVGSSVAGSNVYSNIRLTVPGTGANTGFLNLPWAPGIGSFGIGTIDTPFGLLTAGKGYVSTNGDFFAYVFTVAGKKVGFIGGTPTPSSDFPTSGFATYTIGNVSGNGLPFADNAILDANTGSANLQKAAVISKLYAAYAPDFSPSMGTTFSSTKATAMQATVSIAGTGVNQSSYMGVFIGTFHGDVTDNGTTRTGNGVALSGSYIGSYRTSATERIGRLTSAETTPSTGGGAGQGHAIYGTGTNAASSLVLTPDRLQTDYTLSGGTSGTITDITTTATSQAAFNQPYNTLAGSDYYTVTSANKTDTLTGLTRNDKTYDGGFVGGIVEKREAGGSTSFRTMTSQNPGDSFTITTSATNNRVSAEFTVGNFGGTGVSATFRLGSTTGQNYSTSAFIDDKTYAMRDRPSSLHGDSVTSNTAMVSYNAVAGTTADTNPFTAANITPCKCEFLTWGYWSGDISYSGGGGGVTASAFNPGGRDRINLATYVAGQLATGAMLTGTASFSGTAIGNVRLGSSSYIGVGSYTNSWTFTGGGGGNGNITLNFDGRTYTGTTSVGTAPQFGGNLTGSGSASGVTGNLNGAFFQQGGVLVGQGGSFALNGNVPVSGVSTSYTAGGTFFGGKTGP